MQRYEPDNAQEACDFGGIVDDPIMEEALEHWVVSEWFSERLRHHGEIVGELFGLTIWGRCTSGQAIMMDRVIHDIAVEMQILPGQANEWT